MRFVRCEQCGAKALIAASQCPRCTHPLALRDSRGEAVPLAHCHKCDTYYPRARGGCRFCGTKASSSSTPSLAVVGGVAAVIAVAALGVWQYRARATAHESTSTEPVAQVAVVPSAPAPEPPSADTTMAALGDTLAVDSAAGITTPVAGVPSASTNQVLPAQTATTPAPPPAVAVTRPNPAPPVTSAPAAAPVNRQVAPTVAPSSGIVASASAATTARPGAPVSPGVTGGADRYAGPWSRAVAEQWVNVRGSASRDAAVVGVVTPKTRVQLGEVRAGWRRVRAAGIEGWADARFFSADSARR